MSLALLAATALLAPAPSCGAPPFRTILFESPEVLVVAGKPRRRDGMRITTATVCDRATGRRSFGWQELWADGAVGDGQVVGVLGGRYVHLEEWGSGAESEETQRRVLDVRTGRTTPAVSVSGTDHDGDAEVPLAGGLVELAAGAKPRVMARRPGGATTVLARGETATTLGAATRTAYWLGPDGAARSSRFALPAGAPVPRTPRRSPQGARGMCEPRGTLTLLRTRWFRVYRAQSGTTFVCSRKRGRIRALTTLLPQAPAAGRVQDVRLLDAERVGYRYPTTGGGVVHAVLDVDEARIQHAAVFSAPPAAVALHADGIAAIGAAGVTLTRGTRTAVVDPAPGATEPAVATVPNEGDGAVVYWTTPAGPRSALVP